MRSTVVHRPAPPISQADLNAAKRWVMNYYNSIDTHDPSFASMFFIPNSTLSFGSTRVDGTEGIKNMISWQFKAVHQIEHCISAIHVLHEQLLVQTSVTYTLNRGPPRQMDCMTVFHKRPSHKKATRAYIYADFTSLFESFTSLAGPREPRESGPST